MLHKIDKEQGIKYTFVIESDWVDRINKKDLSFQNDVYNKYNAELKDVKGELIVCNDITKIDGFCNKIIQETWEEYQDFIINRDFKKEQWVYNILDGFAEQESILFRDSDIVICPNYTWDQKDFTQMHLLVFVTDRSIRSIRDLNSSHLELLEKIKTKTYQVIKEIYGYESDIIKSYFHYAPTTYHLHTHFVLVSNTDSNSSVEYSHSLHNVIENIKINSNYYQIVKLQKRF